MQALPCMHTTIHALKESLLFIIQSDLKAVTAAKGSSFYKEHLPLLGEDSQQATTVFAAGDRVWVDLDTEVIKTLQEGHGGWSDGMKEVSVVSILLLHVRTL